NAVLNAQPQKPRERQPIAHLVFGLLVRKIVQGLQYQHSEHHDRINGGSGRHYSSSPRPASAPPPRCRNESAPTAPVDRWLRADHPSQTAPPTASQRRRTRVDPSAPPESCRRAADSHSTVGVTIFRGALMFDRGV